MQQMMLHQNLLVSLKSEIEKLEATLVDLKNLDDVVKKEKRLLKRFA